MTRPIFALPVLAPGALISRRASTAALPFPLNHAATDAPLYYLARNALYHGLRALGVGARDTVLMPSYHHGVEVETVRHVGARVEFYRITSNLRVDFDDLERRARRGARVLYLIHYLGVPQPTRDARALAAQFDLRVVEDCALALLSRDTDGSALGHGADLALYCLYKSLPVPHGGLAVGGPHPLHSPEPPPLASTAHHLAGSLLRGVERTGPRGLRSAVQWTRRTSRHVIDRAIDHVHVGTSHLDPDILHLGASSSVRHLLRHLDLDRAALRRKRNYRHLLDALGDDAAEFSVGELPATTVPLFFPLRVRDRPIALSRLSSRGIEAVDFWSVGDPACSAEEFPEAAALRRHLIEIPIHQDLDEEDLAHVARCVKELVAHG